MHLWPKLEDPRNWPEGRITLGLRLMQGEHRVEVTSGLEEADEIVTSSQFLIDSESNLREAIQKLIASRTNGGSGHQH